MSTDAKLSPATSLKMLAGSLVGMTASAAALPGIENDLAAPPALVITGGNISDGRFVFSLDPRGIAPALRVLIEGVDGAVVDGRVKLWHRVSSGTVTWFTPTHVCDLTCTARTGLTPAAGELAGGLRWASLVVSNSGIIAPGVEVTGGGLVNSANLVTFDAMDAAFITVDLRCTAPTRAAAFLLGINL